MQDVSRLLDNMGRRMDRMFENMDTLFDEVFPESFSTAPATSYRVTKGKNQVTIQVAVPGCTDKDVQVSLADGIISVVAENPLAHIAPHRGDGSLKKEYQFRVGHKVNVIDIAAKVTHGLLTIEVKGQIQPTPPSGSVKVTKG